MFGTVRGLCTLAGAGAAGVLIWLSTQIGQGSTGGYWAAVGILAGAGLTMAFSQLFGGWTKWGMPKISAGVFLIGFLPVLIAAGWVLLAMQPHAGWFRDHVLAWSGDIGIRDVVRDLGTWFGVLAFGIGYSLGLVLEPMPRPVPQRRRAEDRAAADEPTTAERHEVAARPQEAAERDGASEREPVRARPAR